MDMLIERYRMQNGFHHTQSKSQPDIQVEIVHVPASVV